MNESEVRSRIHAAIGEAIYPSATLQRVQRRISEPVRPNNSRLYGFVAAVLAVLLIVALVLTRLELSRPDTPAPVAPPNARILPVDPNTRLPEADLKAARLFGPAAELVTPLNMVADSNGRSLALIGAYADTSEVVLFFRSEPSVAAVHAEIYDRTGLLNFGAGGTSGLPGDAIYTLGGGAHAAADGLAHLNVVADDLQPDFGSPPVPGTWSFSFAIKVPKPTPLELTPTLTSVGTWSFKIDAFEATPAVVRFQAVVDGVSIQQVGGASITLVDSSGAPADAQMGSTGLIGHQFLFWIFGDKPSRMAMTWTRPAAGDYVLQIRAPGMQYRGTLTIPSP